MFFEILHKLRGGVPSNPPPSPCTTMGELFRLYVRGLTNENASHFLSNQSKTKTFIDLKATRKLKPAKNSTRPNLNEIPAHFIPEIRTKGYDVIGVNVFHITQINEIPLQKKVSLIPPVLLLPTLKRAIYTRKNKMRLT